MRDLEMSAVRNFTGLTVFVCAKMCEVVGYKVLWSSASGGGGATAVEGGKDALPNTQMWARNIGRMSEQKRPRWL